MEKSDKQTDVSHPENGVNPLQTLKSPRNSDWRDPEIRNRLIAFVLFTMFPVWGLTLTSCGGGGGGGTANGPPPQTPETPTPSLVTDISGSWDFSNEGSVTFTDNSGASTDPAGGKGTVTIQQNGSNISWTEPILNVTRSGTFSGGIVSVTGKFVVPLDPDVVVTKNIYTSTGPYTSSVTSPGVTTEKIVMSGQGSAAGTYLGGWWTATGTDQLTLTRRKSGSPTVHTLPATDVTTTTARLNGDITSTGSSTTVWFEWGTDPNLSTYNTTTSQSVGSSASTQAVSMDLTGLVTGTTYHFRVAASNASGTSRGAILSFTPGVKPAVDTLSATSVTDNSAVLNGTVIPNGLPATAWFEWGRDSNLATYSATASQSVGSGTVGQTVSATLTDLLPGTHYYFRVAASNSAGTQRGAILGFITTGIYTYANALGFTGASEASVPNDNALSPSRLTIEARVRLKRMGQTSYDHQFILSKGNDKTPGAYYLYATADFFQFAIGRSNYEQVNVATSSISTVNRWYHVAGTYDGSNVRIYVDGVERGSAPANISIGNTAPLTFGFHDMSGFPYFLTGDLCEVRIWNFARTAIQIQADMNLSLAGTETGLVGYWPMSEGFGQTAYDETMNGNDARLGRTPDAEPSDPIWVIR